MSAVMVAGTNISSDSKHKSQSNSTSEDAKHQQKLWFHLKLVYAISCILLLCIMILAWTGYFKLMQLRLELKNEIILESRRFVEFNPEFQFAVDEQENEGPDSSSEQDHVMYPETENLMRVKRQTLRHEHSSRHHRRQLSDYQTDTQHTGGYDALADSHKAQKPYLEEGSGTEVPPDSWVWLTSFSRIPAFALKEFCSATQHHCPPGPTGPPGPPGIQGLLGQKGSLGSPGMKGEKGNQGIIGMTGAKGVKGEIGDSGIPGVDGDKGRRGDKGERGERGLQGISGEPGFPGLVGQKGEKGPKGDYGEMGFNGTDGQPGPQGPPGLPGVPGSNGPPGDPGFNGTIGAPGARGRRGKKGEAGLPGFQGLKGEKGERSDYNCSCAKGAKGDIGPKGIKGTRGQIGFLGYKGPKGEAGPPGPPGPYEDGPPGPQGPQGEKGEKGMKGDRGEPGRPHLNYRVKGSNLVMEKTSPPTTTTTEATTQSTTPVPTLGPRTSECQIRMVGKPMFQRYTGTWWGAWMTDAEPKTSKDANRYWFTRHFTGKIISQYDSIEHFQKDKVDKRHEVDELYFGTGHVVYRGYLLYHRAGYSEILKYNLNTEEIDARVKIPNANYEGKENYVYKTEYNFFDLAVDENGLWVIYGSATDKNELLVSKLDVEEMVIEATVSVPVDHQSYGNGFISCGILYLVEDTNKKSTFINFAYDLYNNELLPNTRLKFSNPFQMNNMIAYDPSSKQIYCWDKGNQLTYPLLT